MRDSKVNSETASKQLIGRSRNTATAGIVLGLTVPFVDFISASVEVDRNRKANQSFTSAVSHLNSIKKHDKSGEVGKLLEDVKGARKETSTNQALAGTRILSSFLAPINPFNIFLAVPSRIRHGNQHERMREILGKIRSIKHANENAATTAPAA